MRHADGTTEEISGRRPACARCRSDTPLPVAFSMAFQPIVDIAAGTVFAYEALVRGREGQAAGDVLSHIEPRMLYKFDQACRVKAIELAGRLFPHDETKLSINFMPNAVYEPDACIRASLLAARRANFDSRRLMFEFTENEPMRDIAHVRRIAASYRSRAFTIAIDDFGAGYSGLGLLADLQPDLVKLDMALIRGIDGCRARQEIVAGLVRITHALGTACVAEGVETAAELRTLKAIGVVLHQGYFFSRPAFEALPSLEFNCFPA